MNTIHIGSKSEYVRVILKPPVSKDGWIEATIEIAVSCFDGRIEASVEAPDIVDFASQLTDMYESLQGEARLLPREEQFTLVVSAQTGGHLLVRGIAWSKATYENKLDFTFGLDQTFLPPVLTQLQEFVDRNLNDRFGLSSAD